MERSFEQDLSLARNGDQEARLRLLEPHLEVLRRRADRLIGRRLRGRESASDLSQSVCRLAISDLAHFRGCTPDAFQAWLVVLLQRRILTRSRFWFARKRDIDRESTTEAAGAEQVSEDLTPSRVVSGREQIAHLYAAMRELSPEHREVIQLARIEGLSHLQMSERLGCSAEACRARLTRAVARLSTIFHRSEDLAAGA